MTRASQPHRARVNPALGFAQTVIDDEQGARIAFVVLKTPHRRGHAFGVVIDHLVCGVCDEHGAVVRSEEHTSELQSQSNLVCRLLLEKKKKKKKKNKV